LRRWKLLKGELLLGELERLMSYHTDPRGRKGKASMWDVFSTVILRPLLGSGTFGEHFSRLHNQELAESSLSERRQKISWHLFRDVMKFLLRPLANPRKHPGAFFSGYRLIGLDGTGFSLRNTGSILKRCEKAVSRRLEAAFAKTTTSVLVELAQPSGSRDWNRTGVGVGVKHQSA
jgi:hypothetical protein